MRSSNYKIKNSTGIGASSNKTSAEIVDLKDIDCTPGQNIADLVCMNDTVLEIDNKSLTNRPDLWGHYGIARELSVIYNCKLKELDYTSFSQSTQDAYKRVIKEDIEKLPLDSISSEGEVVDTLEAAIWMLLKTNDYKHAILGCINLGKDTDTIAAICGSMAGLVYGIEQIPKKWINKLLKKEQLSEMIEKFEKTLTQTKEKAKTS